MKSYIFISFALLTINYCIISYEDKKKQNILFINYLLNLFILTMVNTKFNYQFLFIIQK